jgi:hypothetical protein
LPSGHSGARLALTIHKENGKKSPLVKMNLKGLLLGSPIMDLTEIHWENVLHSKGLIDDAEKALMGTELQRAIDLIKKKDFVGALEVLPLNTFTLFDC